MGKRISSVLGTWVTLAALFTRFYSPDHPLNWIDGALISGFLIFFFYFIFLEYQEYKRTKSFTTNDKASINAYMHDWINRGDSVAIFSRDMTWAHDPKIKGLLTVKAQRNELSLFLPNLIPLAKELKVLGAKVYTYSALNMDPASRFTIINYGKGDAQVAIGRSVNDKHVIDEFSADSHPVFHVAMDLINVLRNGQSKGIQ